MFSMAGDMWLASANPGAEPDKSGRESEEGQRDSEEDEVVHDGFLSASILALPP